MLSVNSLLSFAVFSLLLRFTVAERKCYALNGTQLGDQYGPCDPNAKHSGCCAINGPAGSVDLCLSNGLCMATNDEYMGTIWQSGCTDPTGMDGSCPKMCPDARDKFDHGSKVAAWNVQMCDYGSYCCRAVGDHNSCCNNATAPHIKTKFLGAFKFKTSTAGASSTSAPASAISSAVSSSATPSPTLSPTEVLVVVTSSATPSPTTSADTVLCASEKRQTAVVGGTLAGISGAAIVGLLAVIFYLFKKEKKQRKLKEHYEEQFATSSWGAYGSKLGSKSTVVEMELGKDTVEKDVDIRYIGRGRDL